MTCEKLGETKTELIMRFGLASLLKGFDNYGLNMVSSGAMFACGLCNFQIRCSNKLPWHSTNHKHLHQVQLLLFTFIIYILFLTWANLVVFWLCVFPVLWKITVFGSFAHRIANAALEPLDKHVCFKINYLKVMHFSSLYVYKLI